MALNHSFTFYHADNVDLTCYECATWRVETGNSMYDMAVESLIGGWSAIPCEDDPSVHVGRLCDGPHQHCVSTEIQLSVSIDVTGFSKLTLKTLMSTIVNFNIVFFCSNYLIYTVILLIAAC